MTKDKEVRPGRDRERRLVTTSFGSIQRTTKTNGWKDERWRLWRKREKRRRDEERDEEEEVEKEEGRGSFGPSAPPPRLNV